MTTDLQGPTDPVPPDPRGAGAGAGAGAETGAGARAGAEAGAEGKGGDALSGNASGSVIKGAIARGGLYVISTGLIAVAFAFVFRDLGREGFGLLSVAIAIAAIGQNIGDTAVASIALRLLVAEEPEDRPKLAAQLVGFRFILMPIVGLLAVGFGIVAGYSRELIETVAVVSVASALTSIAAGLVAPLNVEMRVARAALVDFARQLGVAVGLMGAALASATLLGYGTVYLGAGVVAVVLAIVLIEPRWRRVALPSRATARLVDREAAWLALAITVNSLFLKVLTVVASLRTTDAEVGDFGAATRVTEVVAVLSLLMASVAYPLLSRAAIDEDHERFANAVHRVIDGVLLLIGSAVIVIVVAPDILMRVFAGDAFATAAPVLQIQAFALLAAAVTQALIWALLALRAERTLVVTNLVGLAALLTLGFALIGPHGAQGAAFAAIGGEIILLAVTLIALGRLQRSALPSPVSAAKALGLTGVCLAVGLALPLPEIVAALLALAAFGAGALALRIVPQELLQPALARLRPAASAK